ncbi:hypothetical protein BsWGS_11276 [Bradybaena similaris]
MLAVKGQDPTTVCFPTVFQSYYLNLITEDKGQIYVDFNKELWAEVSAVTGVRSINDFANLKSYAITGQGNNSVCHWFKLRQSQIMYRCLPPFAKQVPDATGYFHYITASRMFVSTWDVPTEYDSVFRVFFSVVGGQPYVPVMSQQYGYHGTTDMYIYINQTNAVPAASIFAIPPDCVPSTLNLSTIVG